jgi:hypothetical protein
MLFESYFRHGPAVTPSRERSYSFIMLYDQAVILGLWCFIDQNRSCKHNRSISGGTLAILKSGMNGTFDLNILTLFNIVKRCSHII